MTSVAESAPSGYGAAAIMEVVTNDLGGSASNRVKQYVGTFAYDLATIMLFTSSLVLTFASHNITSRYLFNLSVDGIFPKALGHAHPKHVSPYRASAAVSVAGALVLIGFPVAKTGSGALYARLAGLYSYAFVVLLVMVALAIGVYFLRDQSNGRATGAAVASLVGGVAVAVVSVLATKNFELLTGAAGSGAAILFIAIWAITLGGFAWALVLPRRKPGVYVRIGRDD